MRKKEEGWRPKALTANTTMRNKLTTRKKKKNGRTWGKKKIVKRNLLVDGYLDLDLQESAENEVKKEKEIDEEGVVMEEFDEELLADNGDEEAEEEHLESDLGDEEDDSCWDEEESDEEDNSGQLADENASISCPTCHKSFADGQGNLRVAVARRVASGDADFIQNHVDK